MVAELFHIQSGRSNYERNERSRSRTPSRSYGSLSASSRGSSPGYRTGHNDRDRRGPYQYNEHQRDWCHRQSHTPTRHCGRADHESPRPPHRRPDDDCNRGGRGHPTRRHGRDREEQLRRAALGTVCCHESTPSQSVLTAPRNSLGHPVFPHELADVEDALLSAHAGLATPACYTENEARRHAQALANATTTPMPPTAMELTKEHMGPWATTSSIKTFDEAVNLCRWVHHGDTQAMVYLKWVITQLRDATIPHPSVTRLYSSTGAAMRDATPPQNYPAPPATEDVDMQPVHPACLGVAIGDAPTPTYVHLPESPTMDQVGCDVSTTSMDEALKWYTGIVTTQWPIGMRISPTSIASLTTVSATPLSTDVAAWLTINALAPPREGSSTLRRDAFLRKTILIFSVPGYFDRYAALGHYPDDNLPLEHYPFEMNDLSWCHVVSWFVQHGVHAGSDAVSVIESDAVSVIESFACSRRNSFLRNNDLQNQTFTDDWPRTVSGVEFVVISPSDKWTNLRHGPIRDGVDTFYPNCPGTTMGADEDDGGSGPPASPSAESTYGDATNLYRFTGVPSSKLKPHNPNTGLAAHRDRDRLGRDELDALNTAAAGVPLGRCVALAAIVEVVFINGDLPLHVILIMRGGISTEEGFTWTRAKTISSKASVLIGPNLWYASPLFACINQTHVIQPVYIRVRVDLRGPGAHPVQCQLCRYLAVHRFKRRRKADWEIVQDFLKTGGPVDVLITDGHEIVPESVEVEPVKIRVGLTFEQLACMAFSN
ncbi:hypothetical protein K438DRAFT_2120572 [Mycena galopus ATCC 62051]|nr:hypothetical protein K438DRAFT_2120572 [Mycena galopus ATCC 62051]